MRIEAIETILAHNWSFVRVHTDSGISGIGEGTFWGYPATTHSVIEVLKKYLIGQDPLRIEHHWQNLVPGSLLQGRCRQQRVGGHRHRSVGHRRKALRRARLSTPGRKGTGQGAPVSR